MWYYDPTDGCEWFQGKISLLLGDFSGRRPWIQWQTCVVALREHKWLFYQEDCWYNLNICKWQLLLSLQWRRFLHIYVASPLSQTISNSASRRGSCIARLGEQIKTDKPCVCNGSIESGSKRFLFGVNKVMKEVGATWIARQLCCPQMTSSWHLVEAWQP